MKKNNLLKFNSFCFLTSYHLKVSISCNLYKLLSSCDIKVIPKLLELGNFFELYFDFLKYQRKDFTFGNLYLFQWLSRFLDKYVAIVLGRLIRILAIKRQLNLIFHQIIRKYKIILLITQAVSFFGSSSSQSYMIFLNIIGYNLLLHSHLLRTPILFWVWMELPYFLYVYLSFEIYF